MDPARQERRLAPLIPGIALVLVGAVWLLAPTMQKYLAHRREAKLMHVLQDLNPPPHAKVLNVQITRMGDYVLGTGFYSAESDFENVKAHYIQEFARLVFKYRTNSPDGTLHFCAPGYRASLGQLKVEAGAGEPTGPLLYMLSINWNNNPC